MGNRQPTSHAAIPAFQPASAEFDPGPLPEIVEPETFGTVTTIVNGRYVVQVVDDVGRTGLTGLAVEETNSQTSITVPLPAPSVEALIAALAGTLQPSPGAPGGVRDA